MQRPALVQTTVGLLRDTAARHPDALAFVEMHQRMTFADWDGAADGVASLFVRDGVGPGTVVVLVLPSSIDYAVCYQAAMRLGAITSGINPRLGAREVASIMARTQPALVVIDHDAPVPEPAPKSCSVIRRDELTASLTDRPPSLPRIDATDPVAIVWT